MKIRKLLIIAVLAYTPSAVSADTPPTKVPTYSERLSYMQTHLRSR